MLLGWHVMCHLVALLKMLSVQRVNKHDQLL
uniref:Uncharacterized protein n=1 Tax=Arundo donax TaxID=35708 RepID=A0A0A9FNT4_ARUDO